MVGPFAQAAYWAVVFCACAGCGTSSSQAPSIDAALPGTGYVDGPMTCGLTGDIPTCRPAGSGLTCCFDLGTASGNCVAPTACMASVQFECASASDCAAGNVCCADGVADGGSLAATCLPACPADVPRACRSDAECGDAGACVPLAPGNVGGYAGISKTCAETDGAAAASDATEGATLGDGEGD